MSGRIDEGGPRRSWTRIVWRRLPGDGQRPISRPDPGLQQERTRLAWRRSMLAFAVVGLAVVRAAYVESVHVAVVLALIGLGIAMWLSLTTLRRGRWTWPSQREPEFLEVLRDGTLPLLVTAMAAVLCLAVLANALRLLS